MKHTAPQGKKRLITARPGLLAILALALSLASTLSPAGEEDSLRQLISQYEAVNAELHNALLQMDCPAPLPEFPDRVLSLRKNAAVTVGGEIRTGFVASRNKFPAPEGADPLFGQGRRGRSRTSDFFMSAARLQIDARLPNRWRAYADFNFNGRNGFQEVHRTVNANRPGDINPTANYRREEDDDSYVHEAYIELLKDGHSGFGFRTGLIELPFGLETRPNLIGRSFLDAPNLTGSYLMNPESGNRANILPHASRFLDPVVAALISYELRDIIRFEGGIFQEREGRRLRSFYGNGKLRSETTVPLSHQFGFSVLPLEGWELSATFRNRNSRTRGIHCWADSPYRTDFMHNLADGSGDPSWDAQTGQWSNRGGGRKFGSRRNEQAFTVGLAVEIPNTRLAARLEYAHGWNQGFNKHIYSDNVNLGLSYRLLARLTLHGQAEWLRVKDRSWLAPDGAGGWGRDTRNHSLYRFLLGAEYELMRGLTLEAGWQYEYWGYKSYAADDRRTLIANTFYFGSRFIF